MTEFRPGELVDVTIRAALVMKPKPGHDHVLTLGYAETQPGVYATIDLGPAAKENVTINRVAPVEWPPIPGETPAGLTPAPTVSGGPVVATHHA